MAMAAGHSWWVNTEYNMRHNFTTPADGWVVLWNGATIGCAGPDPVTGAYYGASQGSSNASLCSSLATSLPASDRLYLSGYTYTVPNVNRGLPAYVFFKPREGATMPVDTIAPWSGQATNTNLGTWKPGPTPTTQQEADHLRGYLTGPTDTCAGVACSWAFATSPFSQSDATSLQQIVDCVITSCVSDVLSPTFTMPDCVGMTPEDCETAMNGIGFQGTLDQSPGGVGDVDYSQPEGAVIASNPAAGVAVSTAASEVVDATTNPRACAAYQTDNPHWSTSTTPTMLSYVHIRCTYTGTASYTATMWACSSDPGPEGVDLATAGCETVATTERSVPVTAGQETIAYCPYVTEGDPAVPWADGYWITEGQTNEPDPVLNGTASWSQSGWEPTGP
jgi:hypothetical protein